MRIRLYFKKNTGSTLTIVLFMLFLLTLTAIAVITLTGSELSMSIMNSDRSKALMIAQAGAEKAAQDLDEAVANAQEEAREDASRWVTNEIKSYVENPSIPSPFKDVVKPDGTVIDEEELDKIFYSYYKSQFGERISTKINTRVANEWAPNMSHDIDGNITAIGNEKGTYNYSKIEGDFKTGVKITSTGQFKNIKRSIVAEFSFLTKSNRVTAEIPVTYGKLTKVRINKNNKPDILQNKALIAKGNIISIDGTTNIKGNTVCFGTIPIKTTTNEEDFAASSYKYGGLMAGITQEVWNDASFGIDNINLKSSIKTSLGMSDVEADSFFIDNPGSFNIDGDVATMSNIHALYGNATKASNLTISGTTYARNVILDEASNNATCQFNKVYTTGDFRIDSNNSVVKIGSDSQEGLFCGLKTGHAFDFFRSSAIVVAGDSDLDIKGKIFVGGSICYNDFVNQSGNPYISGVSVLKADSKSAEAFMMHESVTTPSWENYPGNVFFLYKEEQDPSNPSKTGYYVNVGDQNEETKIESSIHNVTGTTSSYLMMNGSSGSLITENNVGIFNIKQRAMHFINIWETFWKTDIGYQSYINTGDISITTADDGRLNGWCYGAVVANGKVYEPTARGFSGGIDHFVSEVEQGEKSYKAAASSFLQNSDLTTLASQKALGGDKNNTNAAIDYSVAPANQDPGKSETFFYNGDGNVVLEQDAEGDVYISTPSYRNNKYRLNKDSEGFIKGIIYSNKDVYIRARSESEIKFKGTIITEGNIVFLGDSKIEYDEATIDIVINENSQAIDNPQPIGNFFKYNVRDIVLKDQNTVQTMRILKVKNIKIKSWKEV